MELELTFRTILGILGTIGLGEYTPLDSYIGFSADMNWNSPMYIESEPWSKSDRQINLQEPLGTFGVQYDIEQIRFFVEHHSSPWEDNDGWGFNHAGVKYLIPVEEHANLYGGVSLHIPELDKKRTNIDNPIVIVGAEYGDTVKLYTEYLTSATDIDGGRASVGVKFMF